MAWILSAFADEAADSSDGQIEALTAAGLNHIDLRSVDGYNVTDLPLDLAPSIKTRLDSAGIAVGMFGSPIGKLDIADDWQVDAQKLDHLAPLADIFDCRAVRIFSYYNKEEQSHETWQAECLDRLGRLKDSCLSCSRPARFRSWLTTGASAT